MGTNQPFRTTANWDQSIQMLDMTFPLVHGSHQSVAAYLVHFDHLAVFMTDGSVTALRHPSQFIEADGDPQAPQCIVLEQQGIQIEIEPVSDQAEATGRSARYRLQLLTRLN